MVQPQEETGGTGLGHRSVSMTRVGKGLYEVTNERGGTMLVGGGGDSPDFTPVELFLVSMAACSATDVDFITSRIAEPTSFDVVSEGEKSKDEGGNHLSDIEITFRVRFPRAPTATAPVSACRGPSPRAGTACARCRARCSVAPR